MRFCEVTKLRQHHTKFLTYNITHVSWNKTILCHSIYTGNKMNDDIDYIPNHHNMEPELEHFVAAMISNASPLANPRATRESHAVDSTVHEILW